MTHVCAHTPDPACPHLRALLQALCDIKTILARHLSPTLQWLPPAAGSPSFLQQLLQPGQAPRLPPPAVFTLKRDLGVYVTAIKLANRAACQLERWPTLTDPQQHGAAGHVPLQLGSPTAPDEARTIGSSIPSPPLATLGEAARVLAALDRLLMHPPFLAPFFGIWPGPHMEALRPFTAALTAAAGPCFAASGRLARALLHACGSAPELALKGADTAQLEAGAALGAARGLLNSVMCTASLLVAAGAVPPDQLRHSPNNNAAKDAGGTVAGTEARALELQWAALGELRPMEFVSLLLPFLRALQPPEAFMLSMAPPAPHATPGLAMVAAQAAVDLTKVLPLLAQHQPPCSGPLYDWMGGWGARYSHSGLAEDAGDAHSAGSSSGSSSSQAELAGPDPNELHRQLDRWVGARDAARPLDPQTPGLTTMAVAKGALVAAAGRRPLPSEVARVVQHGMGLPFFLKRESLAGLPNTIQVGASGAAGGADAPPMPAALKRFGRHACWYPECPTFSCASEADVPMERCSLCRQARYCGRACQVAHWKAGHKQECAKCSGR